MKVYLASSWRNKQQPAAVDYLRSAGHEVYDFRHPAPDNEGFHWSEIDERWQAWGPEEFRNALTHPIAKSGFDRDWRAMQWADAGMLLLPCGRSAHLEAGYFIGASKPLVVVLGLQPCEPELMYKAASLVCLTVVDASLFLHQESSRLAALDQSIALLTGRRVTQ